MDEEHITENQESFSGNRVTDTQRPDECPSPPPLPRQQNDCGGHRACSSKPAKKRHLGCLTAVLVFTVMIFLAFKSCTSLISEIAAELCESGSFASIDNQSRDYGVDEFPDFTEVWSSGSGDSKVLRIPITGTISLDDSGSWSSSSFSSSTALKAIRRATLDDSINGIILEVDSGGGGITDSDIIFNALLSFKAADTNRVIIAHMRDIAASGAYYTSLAADKIIAMPTTITGSIGVILTSLNLRELADKIGVHDTSITSGANKSILNPMRDLSPEQTAMLQAIVDKLHSRFVSLVALHRKIPEARVREIADGRIYLSDQALELGLVDSIGYYEDALKAFGEFSGFDGPYVVRYEQHHSLMEILGSPSFWGAAFSEAIPKASGVKTIELR